MKNKIRQRILALLLIPVIILNSLSPLFAVAYAEELTPTPEVSQETTTPENTTTPEPTIEQSQTTETTTPTTDQITPTETITLTPDQPTLTPTPEDTTGISATPTPANDTSPPIDNSADTTIAESSATLSPTPTETPIVEKICLTNEEIKDSVSEDWNIDIEKGTAETKEKVKLGVKYVFPQENKVSVTFKCLPKEESLRTTLKIEKVKVSDLNLPEGFNPYGEFAYDITTGMTDGDFEYDVTLPTAPDQDSEISYIEKTADEAKNQTEIKTDEIKTIEEGKTSQEGDQVKATGVDHFTIFIVVNPDETATNNGVGNQNNGWVSDNNYATFDNDNDYAIYGFPDLNIPTGSTIEGIEVFIEGYATSSRDLGIALFNKSNTNPDGYTTKKGASLESTESIITLGSSTDKWNKTWTDADFDTDFKVRIDADDDSGTAYLDQVQVKVYYTPVVDNPSLGQSCGMDIALVFDGSGSIDDAEYSQMQSAFVSFVNAFLPGTPTEMSIVEFASGSIVRQVFTNDKTTLINEINEPRVQPGGQYTNYKDGLISAHGLFANRVNPDLIVFASDGNPNRPVESTALAEAITEANSIKTDDIRIITIGIGNDLDSSNLIAISSADAYYASNFDTLATTLSSLAVELCGGTISVNKYIDSVAPANLATDAWTFHVAGPGSYSQDLITTGGQANTGTVTAGTGYSITESSVLTGYTYGSASCTGATNNGTPSGTGVSGIQVGNSDIVTCNFVNTANYTPTKLCHATGAVDHWVEETPATIGALMGHVGIGHQSGNDIIPAIPVFLPLGQNWDAEGQAIWNNGCVIPPQTGTIIVHKDVQGPNGEAITDTSNIFKVKLDGADEQNITDNGTVTYNNVAVGDHTVTESLVASGYSIYGIGTVAGTAGNTSGLTFTVTGGITTDVYVTNRQQNATITIHKNVVGPDGVTDISDTHAFYVQRDGSDQKTISETTNAIYTVAPGTYVFTENSDGDYILDSITGDNNVNPADGASLTVGPNGSAELTFVNKQKKASIVVSKVVKDATGSVISDHQTFTVQLNSGNDDSTLADNHNVTYSVNPGGPFAITEISNANYDNQGCKLATGGDASGITLTSNQSITVTCTNQQKAGTISGYKYKADGTTGILGWTIDLYSCLTSGTDCNTLVDSTTTDATGYYNFTNLLTGFYQVREFLDTLFTPVGNTTHNVTITPNTNSTGNNFSNFKNIEIKVCKKADADGSLTTTTDQTIVAGWGMKLYSDGSLVGTAQVTGADGCYTFTNLGPNHTYRVDEENRTGWTPLSDVNYSYTFGAPVDGVNQSHNFINVQNSTMIVKKVMVGGTDSFDFTGHIAGTISTNNGTITLNGVLPGTYNVTESAKTGWDLTNITCDDTNSTSDLGTRKATFNVTAGETITCTFTNSKRPRLFISKHVTNDNGGTKQASNFTMTVTGTNPSLTSFPGAETGTYVTLDPGSYSVDELPITDYLKTIVTPGCSGTVAYGDLKICDITNNDIQPKLTVTKIVVGDSTPVSSFTLNVGTTTVVSGVQNGFNAGNYIVSESAVTLFNYNTVISGNCASNGSVTLAPGDVKACTITNTRKTGTLRVLKNVDLNGDGDYSDAGETGATDWQWQTSWLGVPEYAHSGNTGDPAISVVTGNHFISETAQPNFHQVSISCVGDLNEMDAPSGHVVNIGENANVVCTFVNAHDTGKIELKKVWNGTPSGAYINIGTSEQASDTDSEWIDGSDGTTGENNVSTNNYYVSETLGISDVNLYTSTLACYNDVNDSDTVDAGDTSHNVNTTTGEMSVGANEDVICVYTNTRNTGSVKVNKLVDTNANGTFETANPADFKWSLDGNGANAMGSTVSGVNTGSHTVSENSVSGYHFVGWYPTNDTSGKSCANPTGTTLPIDISVASDSTTEITLCNTRDTGIITVNKVLNPAGDSGKFNLLIGGTVYKADAGNGDSTGAITLIPGTYIISETSGTNTSLSEYYTELSGDCYNNHGTYEVTLTAGDNKVCTLTNTKNSRIIIEKQTNPDGSTQSFDFATNISGGAFSLKDGETKDTGYTLDAGSYRYVSETATDGWDLTSATCDNGDDISQIHPSAGQTVTCTFTNTKKPTLTLQKIVNNQGVGTATPSNWFLGITGVASGAGPTLGPITVDAGTDYIISEAPGGPAGYTASTWNCDSGVDPDNHPGNAATVNLSAGQNVTCTITNTRDTGTLEFKKVWSGGGGQTTLKIGTNVDGNDIDTQLTGPNGTGPLTTGQNTVGTGKYYLSESGLSSGFSLTDTSCFNDINNNRVNNSEPAVALGSHSSVDVAIGQHIICTYTNTRDTGTIIINKNARNDSEDNFYFDSNFPSGDFELEDDGTSGNGGTPETRTFTIPTGSYWADERDKDGWKLTSIECGGDDHGNVNQGTGRVDFDLDKNETITCTYTNTELGSITLAKDTNPDQGGDVDHRTHFDYSGSLGNGTLYDGDTDYFGDKLPGSYTITEASESGWYLNGITCSAGASVSKDIPNRSVTITLRPGEDVACTFINNQKGKIYGEKFNDKNGNNHDDDGEEDLSGWTMFIDLDNDGILDAGERSTTTNSDGDYSFNNLMPGEYRVCEVQQTGWYSSLPNQTTCQTTTIHANGGDEDELNFGNHRALKVKASKIVCEDESQLPNWGNGAPNITSSTAQNYVNSHEGCTLESGWDFQYGFGSKDGQPGVQKYGDGTQLGLAPIGTGYNDWKMLGTTGGSPAEISITNLEGANKIWVRENLLVDYVSFSYPPDTAPGDSFSAEIYCHTDGLNYDNYDFVSNPAYGNTYYCVAFNALNKGTITVHKDVVAPDGTTDVSDDHDFTVQLDGTDNQSLSETTDVVYTVIPGTYTISELDDPNYTELGCKLVSGETATEFKVDPGTNVDVTCTNQQEEGTITGYKWNDLNSNQERDCISEEPTDGLLHAVSLIQECEMEPKLSGWTIYLDLNRNEQYDEGEPTAITDENGDYTFDNLWPGQYLACEIQKPGWEETTGGCYGIGLGSNAEVNTINFGNHNLIPSFTIAKSNNAVGNKTPGDNVTYTITLNVLDADANNITVTDLLPKGFTYNSGSWTATLNGNPIVIPQPVYSSPGIWSLGNALIGDVFVLTYTANIDNSQQAGIYKDVAWAQGNPLSNSDQVLATALPEGFVDTNFVGTEVTIAKGGYGGGEYKSTTTQEVLGASTSIELPSTGEDTLWVIIATLTLALGAGTLITGIRLKRKDVE
jgi:hypothetical protein